MQIPYNHGMINTNTLPLIHSQIFCLTYNPFDKHKLQSRFYTFPNCEINKQTTTHVFLGFHHHKEQVFNQLIFWFGKKEEEEEEIPENVKQHEVTKVRVPLLERVKTQLDCSVSHSVLGKPTMMKSDVVTCNLVKNPNFLPPLCGAWEENE